VRLAVVVSPNHRHFLSHKSAGFLVGVRGFGFSLDSKVLTHEITWST
jgi:hypothetical protein